MRRFKRLKGGGDGGLGKREREGGEREKQKLKTMTLIRSYIEMEQRIGRGVQKEWSGGEGVGYFVI